MENIVSNSDFSEGLHLWQQNSCHAFVAAEGPGYHHGVRPHSGSNYAVLTHRTQSWQGLEQDITKKVAPGTEYFFAAYVRVHGELHEPVGVQATLKLENETSSTDYLCIARYFNGTIPCLVISYQQRCFININCFARVVASQQSWVKIEGSFDLKNLPRRLVFYLEGPPPGVDLLIDSVSICYKVILLVCDLLRTIFFIRLLFNTMLVYLQHIA
jgi:hypothetical protein